MSDESTTEATAPIEGYEDLNANEVVDVMRDSDPETIEAIKAYEASRDTPRKRVLDFAPPPPPPPEPPDPTERHDVAGWKERARSRFGASPHAVAGALHDVDGLLAEDDVRERLDRFLAPAEDAP